MAARRRPTPIGAVVRDGTRRRAAEETRRRAPAGQGRSLAASRLAVGGVPREQVAEIQRSRLLSAAVAVLDELGYEDVTVAHITRRAGISRRTFYELFANREQCIAAVVTDIAAQVERELREADIKGLRWRERMRIGLWVILCFLEREPTLARVLIVHTLRGNGQVLKAREAIVEQLTAAVDRGREEAAGEAGCSSLTAEGVLGAALAILHARLSRKGSAPVRELLGELAAMVVLPYQGPAVARRMQRRPAPPVPRAQPPRRALPGAADPLAGLPMRMTYRTARVLEGIGRQPGATNRQAAEYAGIADQGQISKLLARLERLGLLANVGEGHAKGESNSWQLTATGTSVTHAIAAHLSQEDAA